MTSVTIGGNLIAITVQNLLNDILLNSAEVNIILLQIEFLIFPA